MNKRPHNSETEMRCESVQESVLARLDNEPDGAVWSAVEKHLLSCPSCAEFAENSMLLNARLREELKDDADTTLLWSRVSAAIDAESRRDAATKTTASRGRTGGRMAVLGSVAAVVMVAIFSFAFIGDSDKHKTPLTVAESINDFLTFKASGRELDVNSSEPQELRRWFVKRLDFEVPLSMAMPAGFTLDGARLCAFLNRRLASFMYHMGEKAVSLYVMTENGLDTILKRVPKDNELSVFLSRGLTNVVWRSDGLVYVVVADFPQNEAVRFARSVGKVTNFSPNKVTYLNDNNFEFVKGNRTDFLEEKQLKLTVTSDAQPLKS